MATKDDDSAHAGQADEQGGIEGRLDRLETQLEAQQETIESQQDRIDEQAAIIEEQREQLEEDDGDVLLNRRTALQAGGILGLLGLGASSASADASGKIGTSSDPLNKLYTAELNGGVTGDTSLTNIAGSGLTIDGSGNLKTSGGSSTSKLATSSSATTALEVVDGGTDFGIGGFSGDAPNVVAGHPQNTTNSSSPKGVTISGGGDTDPFHNIASANYATVGGGQKCQATDKMATVSGGNTNEATKRAATVSGGELNTAKAQGATVVGGNDNDAEGKYSTVFGGSKTKATSESAVAAGDSNIALGGKGAAALGGISNRANSKAAVAVGGRNNDADANYSLVAGRSAESDGNAGAFVWGDSSSTTVKAGAADEVRFQATGGFVIENGNVDAQGGTVENTTGGLTVTTNDNGNLTLDPGSNNELSLSNQSTTSSDDSLLAIDGSGNVKKASSTSLGDVGGSTPSKLETSTNSVTAVEVIDGGNSVSASADSATPPNIINGHPSNNTGGNSVKGVTIAGGGDNSDGTSDANVASANYATVAGGRRTRAKGLQSAVGGGYENEASGDYGTIPGGRLSAAESNDTFVWNDGGGYTSIPNSGVSGLSSDNAVNGEPVTGSNTFSVGASSGFRFVTGSSSVSYIDGSGNFTSSGNVDAQGGTVENSTGSLTVQSSGSNDITLSPGGDVTLSGGNLDTAGNDITSTGGYKIEVTGTDNDLTLNADDKVKVQTDLNFSLNHNIYGNGTEAIGIQGGDVSLPNIGTGNANSLHISGTGDLIESTSSARFKTNIRDLSASTDRVLDLQPRRYEREDSGGQETGLIAEEVDEILPEIVTYDEDGAPYGVQYQNLGVFLVPEVDENRERITDIEDETSDLEADIEAKDARIADQHDRIERLESKVDNKDVTLDALREALDDKDERIEDLEARLATVEAELGIGASASQQGVADD